MTTADVSQLRQRGLVLETETANCEGDLIVATDVVSGTKRIVGRLNELIVETSRKLLLD
jgi:hypothetical protein